MSVREKAAAIDRFVRTIKASGVYDDIKAACIMAGWTNLAGALYPLKGAAPTNNGFLDSDLDAGIGLKGDNTNKYINTNRAGNADGQDDNHVSVYVTSPSRLATSRIIGNSVSGTTAGITTIGDQSGFGVFARNNSLAYRNILGEPMVPSLVGASRSESARYQWRFNGEQRLAEDASDGNIADNMVVYKFSAGDTVRTDPTLSWYSIGTATDLAALDSAVSTLMADLRAIDEAGFDRDALAYIRNVEAADGAYLETGVKQAINAFVVGCKADGIWDALKASCILCGARTISGALVPLVGAAPTAYNFVSADYDRSQGLVGDQAIASYISVALGSDDVPQNDNHVSAYMTSNATDLNTNPWTSDPYDGNGRLRLQDYNGTFYSWNYMPTNLNRGPSATGFTGCARQSPTEVSFRSGGSYNNYASASAAATFSEIHFLRFGDNRMAFFSAGSALDLAALDNRVSTLVAAIAAAI